MTAGADTHRGAPTRVKICGTTSRTDLDLAVEAGADAIGVVCDVTVDSPREVSVDRAQELLSATPPFVTGALVTMPADLDHALDRVERARPDTIQLHGEVDRDLLEGLKDATRSLLLAVDAEDLTTTERYDDVVDGFVIDSADEAGGGGTGEPHDWDRTQRGIERIASPVILAGGLTPDNVEVAIETVRPYAVDVVSGVETRGGVKDPDAVRTFVDRATRSVRSSEAPTEVDSA